MITTTITDQQHRQYENDGYIIIEDLLPADDFAALCEMIDQLLDGELRPELPWKDKLPDEFYTFWEPKLKDRNDLPRRDRVRLMSWMSYHHEGFWNAVTHPTIVSVIADLFGAGVQLFSDTVFMKPAKHGIEAAMHQDTAFWPKLKPNALNYWMAIDPATVENGCLHLIPGTHRQDIEHASDPVQGWTLSDDQVDTSRQIPIELPPNAALFIDSGLVHRSYPNRSDHSRRAMTAVYVADPVEHVEPWNLEYDFKKIPMPESP